MDFRSKLAGAYYKALGMDVAGAYRLMLANHSRSREQIEAQQREMLDVILRLAVEKVPYFRQLGLPPRLEQFPVMRKELLDQHFDALIVDRADASRAQTASGSGTSRVATRMLVDKASYGWHFAGRWRSFNILGLEPAARSVLMAQHRVPNRWKRLKAQIGEEFANRFLITSIAQDEAEARRIHRRIEQLQPVVIEGVASMLHSYVLWCQKLGLRPPRSIRLVRPISENVTAQHRAACEAYFGCLVRSAYGAREFGGCAGECCQTRYHLYPELCFYEVLRADGSIGTSGRGRLLVTTLHNLVMPLIRYDPGDVVTLTDEPCPCGLPLPVMSNIEGRTSEILYRPDGATISSQALHQQICYLNQSDWRVTQDSAAHLDVQIVPTALWGPDDERKLRERIEQFSAGQLSWELRLVDSIPPLANGKSPKVINATEKRY